MYYEEATGKDLFSIVYDPQNTEPIQFNVNGHIIELTILAVFWYDEDKEKSTYVVCRVPDEDSVDVGQIRRMPDGSTAFTPDIPDDIKLRVFDDFKFKLDEASETNNTEQNNNSTHIDTPSNDKNEAHIKIQRKKHLPKLSWYNTNGIPIEQIPIDKQILKKELSEEEKTIASVTTYPILIRNCFIVLGLFIALCITAAISFAGIGGIEGAIIFLAVFLIGSFIIQRFSGIIDGFEIIGGTWRIKMPIGYHILYRLVAPITMIWSMISILILQMFGKNEKTRMLLLPRIAIPKNCGLDDIIYIYKKYEAEADKMDALTMQAEKNAKKKEALAQKSKDAMTKAKLLKAELEKQNKENYSYQTQYKIDQININVDRLKEAQASYEKKVKECNAKLQSEHDKLKQEHIDDVNDLIGR